jgi:Shugoshin C terminus
MPFPHTGASKTADKKYGKEKRTMASWFYDDSKAQQAAAGVKSRSEASSRQLAPVMAPGAAAAAVAAATASAAENQKLRKALAETKQENLKLANQLNRTLEAARSHFKTARETSALLLKKDQELLHVREQLKTLQGLPAILEDMEESPAPCAASTSAATSVSSSDSVSEQPKAAAAPAPRIISSLMDFMSQSPCVSTVGSTAPSPPAAAAGAASKATAKSKAKASNFLAGQLVTAQENSAVSDSSSAADNSGTVSKDVTPEAATTTQKSRVKRPLSEVTAAQQQQQQPQHNAQRQRPSRAATAVVSYKEPKLNVKMRRPSSVHL